MDISSHKPEVGVTHVCTSPEVGALLPDYVLELLDDAASERVELHLNECPHCKAHFLTLLEARSEAGLEEPPAVRRKGKANSSS
jgi:anti-sigma factor RsiW